MTFKDWLEKATKKNGDPLSPATVKHYLDGLKSTSLDMLNFKVIKKPLEDMDLCELDLSVEIILKNKDFLLKDDKGNQMYSNAIKRYRLYVFETSDRWEKEEKQLTDIKNNSSLNETEKEALIKSRRGQGKFRDSLFKKYGKCIITDIDLDKVLVASHIKPWYLCDNNERLDENNGLLLSATYDRLFDAGLITFDHKGKIKISSMINNRNAKILGLRNGKIYDIKYCSAMDKYLDHHNTCIFIK